MTIRTSICAMAMAMAMTAMACSSAVAETPKTPAPRATPTPAPRPTPAPAPAPTSGDARHVRATPWANAPATLAWPKTSRRRQLLVSRGWKADENYVWFVADGRTVVGVYRTATRTELDGAIAKFVRDMTLATQSSPLDAMDWSIAGAISKNPPPPPPPEPGGFPEWYFEQVMKVAMRMDEHVLAPQLSPATTPATP